MRRFRDIGLKLEGLLESFLNIKNIIEGDNLSGFSKCRDGTNG